jgi:hypothetical protein
MRWPHLLANNLWRLTHFLPNPNSGCVHIEQPYLLTTVATNAVDANSRQSRIQSEMHQIRFCSLV